MRKIFIHIGARGGSKGVKNKNIKIFNKKPLIYWTLEQAKKIKFKKEIVVNTDSKEIIKIAKKNKVNYIFKRPKSISTSSSSKFLAWKFAVTKLIRLGHMNINKDLFVDLDCTCPLRNVSDINLMIKKYIKLKNKKTFFDGVFSITEARRNPYFQLMEMKSKFLRISKKLKHPVVRRQDAPKVYEHCGVGYVFNPKFIINKINFLDGNLIGHHVNYNSSLDIDEDLDFKMVEYLHKQRK